MEELTRLGENFLSRVLPYCGRLARPGGGFYSYEIVSRAFDALRGPMLAGDFLSADGEHFVNSACAVMAMQIRDALAERGIPVSIELADRPMDHGGTVRCRIAPAGERATTLELDILKNAQETLLHPPANFPWIMGQTFRHAALKFPEPEYLYLYPVYFLESPFFAGAGERSAIFGGSDEQFNAGRNQLVRDLLIDCGLQPENPAWRKLSSWVVFPAFSPGQEYNLLGLVNLISVKKIVPIDLAREFLGALLTSQAAFIRHLAARALMLYRVAPASPVEAEHYERALRAPDAEDAIRVIAELRWQLEGEDPGKPPPEEWAAQTLASLGELVQRNPAQPWRSDPVFQESGYQELVSNESAGRAESLDRLLVLQKKHPDNWFVNTLLASIGMQRGDQGAEEALRELTLHPPAECAEAHFRLADLLERNHRHTEALAVYADLLRRWPWNLKASQAALRVELSDLLR